MSLSLSEYERYGRQMLLPHVGRAGQEDLKASRCLIVGCGGLGCPCIAYLAGAGVGVLGLCDADTVDVSNLPRQILHRTPSSETEPEYKVSSAQRFVQQLNPNVQVVPIAEHLTASSALRIFDMTTEHDESPRQVGKDDDRIACAWDIVVDCTDTQPVRNLLSDLCVLFDVPLVSGSALKLDGQLSIYNDYLDVEPDFTSRRTLAARRASAGATIDAADIPATSAERLPERGPCYRCIFPRPTPAEATQSCGEAGVLGPVVGAIGVLEALESLKLLLRLGRARRRADAQISDSNAAQPAGSSASAATKERKRPTMHVFSAMAETPWRTIRLRGRRPDCIACGAAPRIGIDVFRRAATGRRGASAETKAAGKEPHAASFGSTEAAEAEALRQYDALCRPPPQQLDDADASDVRLSVRELASSVASAGLGEDASDAAGDVAGEEIEKPSIHDIEARLRQRDTFVLDVRSEVEYDICHLSDSLNIPLDRLSAALSSGTPNEPVSTTTQLLHEALASPSRILVVCRFGNDSLIGARLLRRSLRGAQGSLEAHDDAGNDGGKHSRSRVQDLRGGLDTLARHTSDFPRY